MVICIVGRAAPLIKKNEEKDIKKKRKEKNRAMQKVFWSVLDFGKWFLPSMSQAPVKASGITSLEI